MVEAAKARMSFKWQIRSATCITRRRPSPCVLGSTQKGKNTPMVKGEGLLQRNIIYHFVWRCIHLLSFIFIYIKTKTLFFFLFLVLLDVSLPVWSFSHFEKTAHDIFFKHFCLSTWAMELDTSGWASTLKTTWPGSCASSNAPRSFERKTVESFHGDMSHFKGLVVKEQIHSEVWKQTCEHEFLKEVRSLLINDTNGTTF